MKTTWEMQSALFSGLALDRYRERRVVFYGLVSTQHEAQVNALENQMQWYDDQAALNKNWIVVDRYIDEGITGTLAKKRPNFMRMIEDAKRHTFDLIVTREVCRFARNTVDTLVITRELKNYGIEVFFVSDNIWTMDNDGELRLTIMATMAQEESRKISERVLAGQEISLDNGVLYGNGNILGYDRDRVNKTYVINPEQAETVKMIYELYSQSFGMKEIVTELTRQGRKKASGKLNWECVDISRILRNATYMGYVCHNKSRVNNYIEKKRINNLDETSYELKEGDFPPIVSKELWHRCEMLRKNRQTEYRQPSGAVRRMCKSVTKDIWGQRLRCRCGRSMGKYRWRVLADGTPVYGFRCRLRTSQVCKTVLDELALDAPPIETCNAISVCEWKLDLMVKLIFDQIWGDQKEAVLQACQMLDACDKAVTRNNRESKSGLHAKIQKAETRLMNYAVMRADGELSSDQYQTLTSKTKAEIEEWKTALCDNSMVNEKNTIDLQQIKKALTEMVDVSGPKISMALISEFVEVVTPIEDYCYRWKLNFGPEKLQSERMDLTDPPCLPVLCFTVTFETAKAYRQANHMPMQFRRSSWHDLYVEVYV